MTASSLFYVADLYRKIESCKIRLAQLWRYVRSCSVGFLFLLVAALREIHPIRLKCPVALSNEPRIVVIRLDALGDVLLTSGIFRSLRHRFPKAYITVVVQERCAPILQLNPNIDRILTPFASRGRELFDSLRREWAIVRLYRQMFRHEQVDCVLQPRLGFDYFGENILVRLIDANPTIRYEDQLRIGPARFLLKYLFRSAQNLHPEGTEHEVLRSAKIAEAVTGEFAAAPPELFLNEADHALRKTIFEEVDDKALVVCVAFGAQSARRVWPVDRWSEVINRLALSRTIHAIVICSRDEIAPANDLRDRLRIPSTLISGRFIREIAAVIGSSNLFMGADSGLAHVAAVMGCIPVVVSPHPHNGDPNHQNSPIRFRPFIQGAVVVQPPEALKPCTTGCDATHAHCILQIGVDEVVKCCEPILVSELNDRAEMGDCVRRLT